MSGSSLLASLRRSLDVKEYHQFIQQRDRLKKLLVDDIHCFDQGTLGHFYVLEQIEDCLRDNREHCKNIIYVDEDMGVRQQQWKLYVKDGLDTVEELLMNKYFLFKRPIDELRVHFRCGPRAGQVVPAEHIQFATDIEDIISRYDETEEEGTDLASMIGNAASEDLCRILEELKNILLREKHACTKSTPRYKKHETRQQCYFRLWQLQVDHCIQQIGLVVSSQRILVSKHAQEERLTSNFNTRIDTLKHNVGFCFIVLILLTCFLIYKMS